MIHRATAAFVFVSSLVVYLLTIAPTVVFWDVGEFIAAANMLQVPHPPGSPLFLLLTRLAIIFPFVSDVAMRAHAFTALSSAASILFSYLVMVRFIRNFHESTSSVLDKLAVYGSSAIGALSLAFSNTTWNNSIESEVYGMSMLFLTAVMWLAMRWLERSDRVGNEKYIVLIAYLIGLSLGVHLLALLAIFPIMLIIYFKRYEFSFNSFVKLWAVAVITFLIVYPGIVTVLPGMMDGDWNNTKNEFIAYVPWIIIALVMYGAYTSYQKKQKMLHIALLSMGLIFFGYTTYTTVLIRANMNPPMNENDPSNLARLTSYLSREQYGDAAHWPRRYSQEPQHQGIYTNYTSEMDFAWRYQLHHMFTRYLLWNYAGSEGDWQDARSNMSPFNGVVNTITDTIFDTMPVAGELKDSLFCIPLFIGLFGMWQHFKRDKQMAFVLLVMFLIMGPILALYQRQQDPQPRERDYFYIGAFLVFSTWIAIGVASAIDSIKQGIASPSSAKLAGIGAFALCTIVVPVNMIRVNWDSHNRSGNYVAWDYSYNILQTCEKDAILFTNGDNDTFPLWYLQDVEGVRRDVRIVNLSLVNTPWYIKQMRDSSYYPEAKPVPISLTDAQIERISPVEWEPRNLTLPVPPETFARYGVTDTALVNAGKISYTMNNTFQVGSVKAIKVQDIMVRDIIHTNNWERPVYFAVTVAPDSKIGLDAYLWFHGLAWRLEPRRAPDGDRGMDPAIVHKNLFDEPQEFSTGPQYGYKFRNVANPDVYLDENQSKLMINYRSAFIRLALNYSNVSRDNDKAVACLDRMEAVIPRAKVPMGWELQSDIAAFYYRLGKEDKFNQMASEIEPAVKKLIESRQVNMNSYYNPYRVLLDIYERQKKHKEALELLQGLAAQYPNDANLKQRIAMLEAQIKEQTGNTEAETDSAS